MPGRRPRRRGRALAIGVLTALTAIGGSAGAAERPKPADGGDERRSGLRLDRPRLLRGVSLEMESFSSFRHAAPEVALHDHVLFDQFAERVRDGAKSVTRKTVRSHVLQRFGVEQEIDRLRETMPGRFTTNIGYSLGFHSGLPRVTVRYRTGFSTVRVRAGADGVLGFGIKNERWGEGEITAGYDGEDTVTFQGRFSF